MSELSLSRTRILELFRLLNDELGTMRVRGEVNIVGGAVMCLAFRARDTTADGDAIFEPAASVRAAARQVAKREGLPERWLNEAAKAYVGPHNAFRIFMEMEHLRVFVAEPHYLLAMKCAAMRLGPGVRDLEDIRFLLRYLGIETAKEALGMVEAYIPMEQIPAKTRFALEEILGG